MDPLHSIHGINRCDICKENIAQESMYCDFCHVYLCQTCIGDHISDEYDKHKIVPILEKNSNLMYPTCKIHSTKTCELQCKSCNLFICVICSASPKHKGHDFIILKDIYKTKKMSMEKNIEEIEKVIAPTYEEIKNGLINQIASLDDEYSKITKVMTDQGKKWHIEIDKVIIKMKYEMKNIKDKHRSILDKHLNEIKQIESLIERNLSALKELEESNVVSVIVEHRSRVEEFRKLLPKVQVTLPTFCPKPIDVEQLYEMFGSLKPFASTIDVDGYKIKFPEVWPRELLDLPEIIQTFNTGYKDLRSISFSNVEEIWTSAKKIDIKCFNTDGKCMRTISTTSKFMPNDIAVTSGGELVYCVLFNWSLKTLNKIKDGKIAEIARFQEWTPINLCVTSTGDFLVALYHNDKIRFKVVRYSGSTEKQTIQFHEGKPLYSGNTKVKYITESRNHDICVADCGAAAVVVVSQDGKLRFRYTGQPSLATKKAFHPFGITTDSQSRILTADPNNHCIHILDQDGQFLRYIENVNNPYGLCIDKIDNLFVAEYYTGDVKVIKYLKEADFLHYM